MEGAAAATPKLSRVATRRQRGLIITQKHALALLRKEMDSKWQNQQLPVHPADTQKETQRTEGRRGCRAFCTVCTAADTGTGQLVCQTAEDMHTPPHFKTEPHQSSCLISASDSCICACDCIRKDAAGGMSRTQSPALMREGKGAADVQLYPSSRAGLVSADNTHRLCFKPKALFCKLRISTTKADKRAKSIL